MGIKATISRAALFALGAVSVLGIAALIVLGQGPWSGARRAAAAGLPATSAPAVAPLRIGLVPERDIFAMHRRYRVLAEYLSAKLHRPVEIATLNTYQAVLDDFADKQIDAAFLGSLVAVVAYDRQDARVLLKTELPDQVSTYHGVIFVPDASPIRSIDDLAGRSMAMVPTTSGGQLYPMAMLVEKKLFDGPNPPKITWVGTHDEAILAVADGKFDAAAVKDLRLEALEKSHPGLKLRRVATSDPFPNSALVLRADVAEQLGPQLAKVMLEMPADPDGRRTLEALGAARFLPCDIDEFAHVYDLIDQLGPAWGQLGISGQPPHRPATRPRPRAGP